MPPISTALDIVRLASSQSRKIEMEIEMEMIWMNDGVSIAERVRRSRAIIVRIWSDHLSCLVSSGPDILGIVTSQMTHMNSPARRLHRVRASSGLAIVSTGILQLDSSLV